MVPFGILDPSSVVGFRQQHTENRSRICAFAFDDAAVIAHDLGDER
jgi:hypothetical protein